MGMKASAGRVRTPPISGTSRGIARPSRRLSLQQEISPMRHPRLALAAAAALASVVAVAPPTSSAQQQPQQPAAAVQPANAEAQQVPVKQVVLFSSGVGYFEHFGSVKGNGSTELQFKTQQI